ncbi:LLM class F420-dependent oxidoreductase [Lapillicoccus jejuensis]|uniref:F420-dependent oxidoreductase-like protein n=1 Tax=Lapillicoccus jejuensis TaxID=402171 RepID=A0A542E4K4_9MICO|nr:LLM class F420-dependent oxidoreductase [Lapillicoccus jejuensis]TQJ10278.1 F420-dependent oxidoreductase-like protein [Lapillicoccus jejuensis]
MRLGINLGYWGSGNDADNVLLAQEADRLGYDVAWVAEAYGSDAPTVLSWVGAKTERIGLGAAVMQIPARTPAMTAMTAATLDTLSGGRFHLGLGVSGPQVSEGWHGVPFASPLGRTREYVDIVRAALRRETVAYDGRHFTLPLPDGPGKALKLTVHPVREHIPVYLASVGPKNLELAGEIADGWLAIFFSPEHSGELVESVRTGARRAGKGADGGDPLAGFDIVPTVPVVIGDDVQACADQVRAYAALYVGGMGSREKNFYNQLAVRMGFEEAAAEIQDLYLARRHRDAAAAVPFEFLDATALLGPKERIRERVQRYADAGVTTLTVSSTAPTTDERLDVVRTMADVLS